MRAILKQRSKPTRELSVRVENVNRRLESRYPMGAIAVIDPDEYQSPLLYGTTANGGSNVLYGRKANGGSNKKYGTTRRNQVDRLSYECSPENGRFNVDINFGGSMNLSKASAALKQIEQNLNTVRQRSL
jgi:hypothetical protein